MQLYITGDDNLSKGIVNSTNCEITSDSTIESSIPEPEPDYNYFINVSENNETQSITTDLNTSLNWPNNKDTNMHYSTLELNRPNEKKNNYVKYR